MGKLKYDEKYYTFLDGLREIGVTNMFGAAPHLSTVFPELDEKLARKVLVDWMETFSSRHPKPPKVVKVLGNIDDQNANWLHKKRGEGSEK